MRLLFKVGIDVAHIYLGIVNPEIDRHSLTIFSKLFFQSDRQPHALVLITVVIVKKKKKKNHWKNPRNENQSSARNAYVSHCCSLSYQYYTKRFVHPARLNELSVAAYMYMYAHTQRVHVFQPSLVVYLFQSTSLLSPPLFRNDARAHNRAVYTYRGSSLSTL